MFILPFLLWYVRSFRSRDSDTHVVHCRILAHVNSVDSALYALVHAAGDRQRILKWKLGNFANTNCCIFVCKCSGGFFIFLSSHLKDGWSPRNQFHSVYPVTVLKWKLGNFPNTNWCIFVCKASGGLFIILSSHCKKRAVWGVRLGANSTPYTLLHITLTSPRLASSFSQLIYPSPCSLPSVRGCMDPLWRDRSCIQRMIHHPRRFQVHSSNRNLLSTVYSRRYIGFLSYSLPSAKIHWSVVFYIL